MSHSCSVLTIHDMVSGSFILSKLEVADIAGDDAAYGYITLSPWLPNVKVTVTLWLSVPIMDHQLCR